MPVPAGIHPDIYEILENALRAPHEYCFTTRSEATTLRHRLYAARRKLAAAAHPLAAALDTLSITVPRERRRAAPTRDALVQGQTEWYWRIGDGVIYSSLRSQIDDHAAAAQAPAQQAQAQQARREARPQPGAAAAIDDFLRRTKDGDGDGDGG